jgi:putative hydrolase of the HAD superfamily
VCEEERGKAGVIKAVIFDFGRVISAQKPAALFRSYEEDLGLAPGTINTTMFDSQAWQDALVGRKTAGEFWSAIGPELGLKSIEAVSSFRCRYHADEAVNDGVLALIGRLHGRYKLAVLSNSPPGLRRWLAEWHIDEFFHVVFCSGDEGVAKPDPAAFRITLERLGVKPEEAVFIDDTMEHVEAARSLGLRAVLFTTASALVEALEDLLP